MCLVFSSSFPLDINTTLCQQNSVLKYDDAFVNSICGCNNRVKTINLCLKDENTDSSDDKLINLLEGIRYQTCGVSIAVGDHKLGTP